LIVVEQSAPRAAKSADRIDGAMMAGGDILEMKVRRKFAEGLEMRNTKSLLQIAEAIRMPILAEGPIRAVVEGLVRNTFGRHLIRQSKAPRPKVLS
jgi:hypothetical protein